MTNRNRELVANLTSEENKYCISHLIPYVDRTYNSFNLKDLKIKKSNVITTLVEKYIITPTNYQDEYVFNPDYYAKIESLYSTFKIIWNKKRFNYVVQKHRESGAA
jgi:hypothetical protein